MTPAQLTARQAAAVVAAILPHHGHETIMAAIRAQAEEPPPPITIEIGPGPIENAPVEEEIRISTPDEFNAWLDSQLRQIDNERWYRQAQEEDAC